MTLTEVISAVAVAHGNHNLLGPEILHATPCVLPLPRTFPVRAGGWSMDVVATDG